MDAQLVSALADRYEIERELGQGGMAVVYLARDVKHGREVAIKVLRPELGSSLGAERFLREIATAARLTHPNILPLHDSGEAGGLLYYVMPYVRGESLRSRLDRERQLPIDDAIVLARQVASALDHAHEQGIVHRDIKPENILMGGGGQAIVADFGLARALYSAASAPLTQSGLAVGTPAYMSPEQATGERAIDARTDVYSLGCVVFEMISGLPPFRGATINAVIAHHIATPPPSLCIDRASCPPSVDLAVRRALAKTPADRYRTAGEFVRALGSHAVTEGTSTALPARARREPGVLAGVGVLTLAAIGAAAFAALKDGESAQLEASRLVVMPFVAETPGDASTEAGIAFRRQLTQSLADWDGLTLADEERVREALAERGDATRLDGAVRLARELGAGRMIRGTAQQTGDSIVVTATTYDVARGEVLRSRELTYAAAAPPSRDQIRPLVNAMIRNRDELPWAASGDTRRPSLGAWVAYDSGRTGLDAWDLTEAEEQFRQAVRIDAAHPQAQLWLAQVLTWKHDSLARSDRRHAALQAMELHAHLTPRDGEMAIGLLALAESRFPAACGAFRRVVERAVRDFAAWYGLGDCQTLDPVILKDVRSPSGFAFRGSYHSGASAYLRALEALPLARPDFAYLRLSTVLYTQVNQQRPGFQAAGDTVRYRAFPAFLADTVAYVPFPVATLVGAMRDVAPRAHTGALERNKAMLRDLFAQWVRVSPVNPLAHEKLAGLLEITGDIAPGTSGRTSALTATRTARGFAADPLRQLALASDEVRLLVKNEDFVAAAALADSLLAAHAAPTAAQADVLLGLAALTGRVQRATELLRALSLTSRAPLRGDGQQMAIPPLLAQQLAGARASAMFGVCSDSVRTLREWMDRSLASHYSERAERERVRDALTWRPLSQAVPCLGASAVTGIAASDRLLALQQTLAARGGAALRTGYDGLQTARSGLRPGDVAIDYTYHEAWLLAQAGDTVRAIAHLDRSLAALSTLGTYLISEPSQAAGLVRALILRARLAQAQRDDSTARRSATAAAALWKNADTTLHSEVTAMRALAAVP